MALGSHPAFSRMDSVGGEAWLLLGALPKESVVVHHDI